MVSFFTGLNRIYTEELTNVDLVTGTRSKRRSYTALTTYSLMETAFDADSQHAIAHDFTLQSNHPSRRTQIKSANGIP